MRDSVAFGAILAMWVFAAISALSDAVWPLAAGTVATGILIITLYLERNKHND